MAEAQAGLCPLLRFGQSPATVATHVAQPVYMASPYSREVVGADGVWEYARSVEVVRKAALAQAALMAAGVTAISPIVMSGAMVHATCRFEARRAAGFDGVVDPLDGAAWLQWCWPLLRVCGAVVVPDLPGWDRSNGIWAEVMFAIDRAIPVFVYAEVGG